MIGFAAALLLSVAGPAAGCSATDPPWLELAVIPSEPAGPDSAQRIAVHADGCVAIEFPRTDVRAGAYAFQLSGEEVAALARALRDDGIDRFDRQWVRASVRAHEESIQAAPAAGELQVSAVLCGDTHRVAWREGASTRVVSWYALAHDAARHPEVPELVALKRFVDRLGALALDQRLRRVADAKVAP